MQQAPRVVFEGEEYRPGGRKQKAPSKIIALVIRCSGGIIKNDTQANLLLIGFILIAGVIIYVVNFGGNSTSSGSHPTAGTTITPDFKKQMQKDAENILKQKAKR